MMNLEWKGQKIQNFVNCSKMHPNVYGVFTHNEAQSDELLVIFYLMLDEWYKSELYRPEVRSQKRLFEILKHREIRLNYLVQNMEEPNTWYECYKVVDGPQNEQGKLKI